MNECLCFLRYAELGIHTYQGTSIFGHVAQTNKNPLPWHIHTYICLHAQGTPTLTELVIPEGLCSFLLFFFFCRPNARFSDISGSPPAPTAPYTQASRYVYSVDMYVITMRTTVACCIIILPHARATQNKRKKKWLQAYLTKKGSRRSQNNTSITHS